MRVQEQKALIDALYALQNNEPVEIQGKNKKVTLQASDVTAFINKTLTAYFESVPTKKDSLIDGGVVTQDTSAPTITGIDAVFRNINLPSDKLSWEVANKGKAIALSEIGRGGKISFERQEGSTKIAKVKLFGGGLSIPWETIVEKKYWELSQILEESRDAKNETYANVHYPLLAKAGANNITTYDTTHTTEVEKDVATLNKAVYEAIERLKTKYSSMETRPLVLVANYALRERIERAMRTKTDNGNGDSLILTSQISGVYYTTHASIGEGRAILSLPQKKAQNSRRSDVGDKTWENNETNGLSLGAFMAVGAIVADADEHGQVNFT